MKAYKKYFCIISMLICLGISFMFCSCESEKQENDNNNTQIAQPENTNYPVEGIWCGSIAGSFLRNIKNEYLSETLTVKYYIHFLPGGGIKTMYEMGLSKSSWKVEDFAWEINGYIVDLSNDNKLIIVDDVFKYTIPSIYGWGWTWYNTLAKVTTFSKIGYDF